MSDVRKTRVADGTDSGTRLDRFVQDMYREHSRSRLQDWIRNAQVLVNGNAEKASYRLRPGDRVEVTPAKLAPLRASPEAIPVRILFEDGDLVAIEKPAGIVVHAGAGVNAGTLVNALLYHFESLSSVGGDLRPGIVHRLDRHTSGVLLVAKTDASHRSLAEQFASREVEKTYLALVHGIMKTDRGRIERPIARDPSRRVRMTARLGRGRAAWTEYRVLRQFRGFTYLEVRIGTGRTHQIRVHLASVGHPVAGDRLYGAAAEVPGQPPLNRYFLHAHRIRFRRPSTGEPVAIESPLPAELAAWMESLPV